MEMVEAAVVVRRGKSIKTEKKGNGQLPRAKREHTRGAGGASCVIISAGNAREGGGGSDVMYV